MANINDYLLWRGDIELSKDHPLNEIDSMILARFSYLRIDKIKMEKIETIESISNKMKNLSNEEFLYNGDKELITNLGASKRFKDMIVTDYIKHSDSKTEKQFGAISIHTSPKEIYISYIGTDNTIYGWKEDFNMAFMENVPCQIEGKEYLENIAKKYMNKKIRIGGHSKGGNVAIYSAITTDAKIQNRIIKVDNFDGPGFNKKITNEYEKGEILDKIETYIPQDSIIGRLLNHNEKITISYSLEKGIYQHDIYSWQVLKDEMIKSEKNTESSEIFNKTLDNWLETTTKEQRKIMVDSIFEVILSTKAESFVDITKSITVNLPIILKKYKEISEEDKKVIMDMLKVIFGSYINIVKETETAKLDKTKEKLLGSNK